MKVTFTVCCMFLMKITRPTYAGSEHPRREDFDFSSLFLHLVDMTYLLFSLSQYHFLRAFIFILHNNLLYFSQDKHTLYLVPDSKQIEYFFIIIFKLM